MLADFPAVCEGFLLWVVGSIFVVLGVHFGAILETLGSILLTLGSPGALFEVRASIWRPRAPEVRKIMDFSLTPPPVCLQLGPILGNCLVFWMFFRTLYSEPGF